MIISELQSACDAKGVKLATRPASTKPGSDWTPGTRSYKATLTYQGRQLTVDYHQGPGIRHEPRSADVLSCVLLDASSGELPTFEDFANEYGYDVDSRRAASLYKACRKVAPKVRKLLGEDFDYFSRLKH